MSILLNIRQPSLAVIASLSSIPFSFGFLFIVWEYGSHDPFSLKPKFLDYVSSNIHYILISAFIIAISLYLIVNTYIMFSKCTHLGWKRLSLVIAIISGVSLGGGIFFNTGSHLNVIEFFEILVSTIIGFASAIFLILGTRLLIIWINDGFKSSR
ncbi:MAG: hypothetical protein ACI9U5_000671 [Colwellia sp.]|jgi:hypothetical protein